jgi:hypothetical protein
MISTLRSLALCRPCLAVLLILGAAGAARAETVYVVNDTSVPLVVQATVIIRNVPRNDQQVLLKGGDPATAVTMLPGAKILTITDPRNGNRILFRSPIPASDTDQVYLIVTDPRTGIRVVRRP